MSSYPGAVSRVLVAGRMGLAAFVSVLVLLSCAQKSDVSRAETQDPTAVPSLSPAVASQNPDEALLTVVQTMGLVTMPPDTKAIDFTVKSLDGKSYTLSQLKGKVVLLNFWATWCPPCREEMPSLESMYQDLKGHDDFVVLAVDYMEDAKTAQKFIDQNGYTFPIVLDDKGDVGAHYGIQAIPATYLIDKKGNVVAGTPGAHDWSNPAVKAGIEYLLSRNG